MPSLILVLEDELHSTQPIFFHFYKIGPDDKVLFLSSFAAQPIVTSVLLLICLP